MGPTLLLHQSAAAEGRIRVDLRLTGLGATVTAASVVAFVMSDDDRERMRWYLEDYLEYPLDPSATLADRSE